MNIHKPVKETLIINEIDSLLENNQLQQLSDLLNSNEIPKNILNFS